MAAKYPGCTIFVSNLNPTVTIDDLMTLFAMCGRIKSMTSIQSGQAQVIMVTESEAEEAVEAFHNQILDGKQIRVELKYNTKNNNVSKNGANGHGIPSSIETVKHVEAMKAGRSDCIVDNNFKIPQQPLPKDTKVGDILDILVPEITSPGEFWFQIRENCVLLKNLMDDMR